MTTEMTKRQLTIAECKPHLEPPLTTGDAILTSHPTWELEEIVINGVKEKSWKNQPPHYRAWLLPLLKQWKDRDMISTPAPAPAPEDARNTWTFGQVQAKAEEWAAFLRSLGVKTGTRVVIGGGNCAE